MRPLPPLLRLLPRLTSSQAPRQPPRPPASQWVLPPARYRPSIKCSCGQTSSSSKLTVGSYAAKLEFSESRLGAEDVSVQIQWLGSDRWQGWSQRWGKQDLWTGIFGTISIWTITITIFNSSFWRSPKLQRDEFVSPDFAEFIYGLALFILIMSMSSIC